MQIKRPKCSPAIKLIGRICPEAMLAVLRCLDLLRAGRWWITRVGHSSDGDYFVVAYRPTNRAGTWEAVFGTDGLCWQD
jgi:hypothetical protein